jgi:hypothetical protein
LLDDGGAAAWKARSSRSDTASNPLVDGADLERGAGAAAAAAGVEAAAVLLDDICCNIGAVEAMRGRREEAAEMRGARGRQNNGARKIRST